MFVSGLDAKRNRVQSEPLARPCSENMDRRNSDVISAANVLGALAVFQS